MANIEIAATTSRQVVVNADVIKQFGTELRGGHLLEAMMVMMRRARSTTR